MGKHGTIHPTDNTVAARNSVVGNGSWASAEGDGEEDGVWVGVAV